jgi:replicative DNA helicase
MNNGGSKGGGGEAGAVLSPYSETAERGLLGCVLLDGASAMDAAREAGCCGEWFWDARHRVVWEACVSVANSGKVFGLLLVVEALKSAGALEQVGDLPGVSGLQNEACSGAQLPAHVEVVRGYWQRRKGAAVLHRAMDQVLAAEKAEPVLASALEDLGALVSLVGEKRFWQIRPALERVVAMLDTYHKGGQQLRGLPTGFEFNDKVVRGIRDRHYYVVAGRPGSGKTTFAMNMAAYWALDYVWKDEGGLERRGIPVGVFSLEMDVESLVERLLFARADTSQGKFYQGYMSNEALKRLLGATGGLAGANLYVDDEPNQTIGQIAVKARRMVREHGVKAFVLDYLQLVRPNWQRQGRADPVQELTEISAEIVRLKKELAVPWVVLCQMNRNIETAEVTRKPKLSDLKDCGAIEQDADVVEFLYPPPREKPRKLKEGETPGPTEEDKIADVVTRGGTVEVEFSEWPQRVDAYVAKNRYGPTGTVKLLFEKNKGLFQDWHRWAVEKGIEQAKKGERPGRGDEELL